MKNKILLTVIFSTLCFLQASVTAQPQYASPEHILIGDDVRLSFPHQIISGADFKYPLRNGLRLSYGDILAMPDYFGVIGVPISSGSTIEQREKIFALAFSQLNQAQNLAEVYQILQDEKRKVKQAIDEGKNLEEVYAAICSDGDKQIFKLTHGRILLFQITSFDHFGDDALSAYTTGHQLAIKHAITAFLISHNQKTTNNKNANEVIRQCNAAANPDDCLQASALIVLKQAYAENAFASHFLTDRFAAGHIRTPFHQVHDQAGSGYLIQALGSLVADTMHDEDNVNGLIVKNSLGARWIAYGDTRYLSKENQKNKDAIQKITQQSVDQIYTAFLTGRDPDPKSKLLLKSIPYALPPQTTFAGHVQSQPLFSLMGNKVVRRASICDPYNFSNPFSIWRPALILAAEAFCPHQTESEKTKNLRNYIAYGVR